MKLEYHLMFGVPMLALFIYSVILHEIAHGWVAERFGDSTARSKGRITLNPIPHIDPFMSLFLPAAMYLMSGGLIFGGAKGVPVQMEALKPRLLGQIAVALAGVTVNLLLAVIFKLLMGPAGAVTFWPQLDNVLEKTGWLNCLLVVFNLFPLPPLDGFAVLSAFLPVKLRLKTYRMQTLGFVVIVALLIFVPALRNLFMRSVNGLWGVLP